MQVALKSHIFKYVIILHKNNGRCLRVPAGMLKGNKVKILNSTRCCKLQFILCPPGSMSVKDVKAGKEEASQKTCHYVT